MASFNTNPLSRDVLARAFLSPILMELSNFTPEERTPWGGDEIPKLKCMLGWNGGVVGESWEVSDVEPFVTHCELGYARKVSLRDLLDIAPDLLLGGHHTRFGGRMPFLVKLLNSGSPLPFFSDIEDVLSKIEKGDFKDECRLFARKVLFGLRNSNYNSIHLILSSLEDMMAKGGGEIFERLYAVHNKMLSRNLSVQVHPSPLSGRPSKTEAWYIIGAEDGAGVYLGWKDGVERDDVLHALSFGEDISRLMNFVEVEGGDIFFIQGGTPHAIGAGVFLLEVQEPSDVTFRYYDWGGRGRDVQRKLHVEMAVSATDWSLPKGDTLVQLLKRSPNLVEGIGVLEKKVTLEPHFEISHISLQGGASYENRGTGVQCVVAIRGGVAISTNSGLLHVGQGRSAIIPAPLERCSITPLNDEAAFIKVSLP